jgi:hypothetical protein
VVFVTEDGIEDSLYAGLVTEDAHGPSPSFDLTKAPLDRVGRPNSLTPRLVLEQEELEKVIQVSTQARDGGRVGSFPSIRETAGSTSSLGLRRCMTDSMEILLGLLTIGLPDLVEDVARLVGPASLGRDAGVDESQGGQETLLTSVNSFSGSTTTIFPVASS